MKDIKEPKWCHPGGKLRELGPESLSDTELLAIIIGTGTKGKTAENIAKEIIEKFGGFKGMSHQPLSKFQFKGLGEVKLNRLIAAFEIAKRIVKKVIEEK